MSDVARLIVGLAAALGTGRAIDLGIDADRRDALAQTLELIPPGNSEAEAAIVVCDDPPYDREGLASVLSQLSELLDSAPAAILSVADAVLAGQPEGWSASELEQALADAGLRPAWMGLTDAHGSLGRRAGITCAIPGTAGPEALGLLAGGPLGLAFDDVPPAPAETKARVCIASYEFVGPTRTGGIGTAYTSLAEALATAGHEVTVLFTGWPDPLGDPIDWWTDHYRERGIELIELPAQPERPIASGHRHADRAMQAFEWLRERDGSFDVVHFPEVLGHGFYASTAKRLGLAFAETTLVVGSHSSTTWVLETNGTLTHAPDDFADDFIERGSVAAADALVGPSAYMLDWMRSRGWRLPRRSFVQQYVRSAAVERFAAEPPPPGGTGETEIVFFGRLEPRKGLRVFCDALDRMAAAPGDLSIRVTMLGKRSSIDGEDAGTWVRRRAADWPWPVELIDGFNQPQAVEYLRSPGRRLTVIPSLADNSPNTVYEALALQVPFVASRVGGTAELIDPRDLDTHTFDPGDGGPEGGVALAQRLTAAVAARKLDAPRAAVDAEICRRAHVEWHAALAARDPQAAAGSRDSPEITVCVVGPPALAQATEESARAAGARKVVVAPTHADLEVPDGPRLSLFVSAGAELRPDAIEILSRASLNGGGDVVAAAVEARGTNGAALRVPVGGPALAGLFRRCFGDAAFAMRGDTLERLGGFDRRVPADLQAHHLLCRAAIAGMATDVVPQALAAIDAERLPPIEHASAARRAPAIVDAYRAAPPELLAELPLLSQQLWAAMRRREADYSELYGERFGRMTIPARRVIHRIRLLQQRWLRLRRSIGR